MPDKAVQRWHVIQDHVGARDFSPCSIKEVGVQRFVVRIVISDEVPAGVRKH